MLNDQAAGQPGCILARCRTSSGGTVEIKVLDLSVAGCLVSRGGCSLKDDDRVLITLPGLSSMTAKVLWVEEDTAGLGFERHLYEPVLAHLRQNCTAKVQA